MWVWDQSAGTMSKDGEVVGTGYAGNGYGKNNPDAQGVVNVGPLPQGRWTIGPPRNSKKTGPYTLPLTPALATKTKGRSGFLIHGDSARSPGKASHGCIVIARALREKIWESGDRVLEVVR